MSLAFDLSALWIVLAAVVGYLLLIWPSSRLSPCIRSGIFLFAWLLHAWAWSNSLLDTPAHFGFAAASSMTVWLTMGVYIVESRWFTALPAPRALLLLGAVVVPLSWLFPGTSSHLWPSSWLAVHLVLGLSSYVLFAIAVVHGWLMTRAEKAMRALTPKPPELPLLTLERLTFRFVQAGFLLLTATLLVGGVFAEQLYGANHSWSSSHKTVFSVLAWLTFSGLLAGRHWLGWRGRKAVHVLYIGAGLLLLAYVGSRFVLEVILHR